MCSSRVRSRMAVRPGTRRLSRSARYFACTTSGSKAIGLPFGGDHAYVTKHTANVKHPASRRAPASDFADRIPPAGAAVPALATLTAGGKCNPLIDSIIDGSHESTLLRSRLPTASERQPVVMELGWRPGRYIR